MNKKQLIINLKREFWGQEVGVRVASGLGLCPSHRLTVGPEPPLLSLGLGSSSPQQHEEPARTPRGLTGPRGLLQVLGGCLFTPSLWSPQCLPQASTP